MGDAWEWNVAGGTKVIARIELPARVESVWLGPRLVSRSSAGGKGADHVILLPPPKTQPEAAEVYRAAASSGEAVVTFEPVGFACTLRIDGVVVPPDRAPDEEAVACAPATRRIFGIPAARLAVYGAAAFFAVAVCTGPAALRSIQNSRARAKIAAETTETVHTETVTASDGSIAAHFPADFDSTVDEQGAVITLHRSKKHEMVVLISSLRPDLDEPRDLDRIMMKVLADFTRESGATMSTTITEDGLCQGFRGAVSTATLSNPNLPGDIAQKVVGCSMLRKGRGYFFAYFVPEFLVESEEPALRKIVDATDIFDLTSAFVPFPAPEPDAIEDRDPVPPPTTTGRVSFSAQGAFLIPANPGDARGPVTSRPAPPRRPARSFPIVRANASPTPAPLPSVRMVNGTAEVSGPAYVNGVNKAADADRDRRMRQNRQRVPW